MGALSGLSDAYDRFTERAFQGQGREFFSHHPGNISMDTNQAGNTLESQHTVSKELLMFAAVPGGGKMVHTSVKILMGRLANPRLAMKVFWPLLLTDYPPHYKIGRISAHLNKFFESRGGMDAKPGTTVPPVGPGIRPRPIKPSRPTRSGQTSKPFWSNGKPKCKKGFRYDFKRKLCVKIK